MISPMELQFMKACLGRPHVKVDVCKQTPETGARPSKYVEKSILEGEAGAFCKV